MASSSVLVIGGTGTLGRPVVAELRRRDHGVRVLSRRADAAVPDGVGLARGDAVTGGGLSAAMDGVDTVVLSLVDRRHMSRAETAAMATVLGAVGDRHLIDVSIVGVDRHRYAYYRAKWAAEQLLVASPARWTIQRATQFHDLVDAFLGFPVFFRTPHLAFQPIDPTQVAVRLADLVEAGPSGRAPDLGGPQLVPVADLAAERRRIVGRAARLIPLPAMGFLGDFDRGLHHAPDHRAGGPTWAQWLADRAAQPPPAA